MSDIILERRNPALALITIHRPHKRNALDGPAWRDLGRAFTALQDDRDLRAIILTGAGGAFCAGDDIPAFAAVRNDPIAGKAYWDTIMDAYAAISGARVPVIAAISGPCVGGGCTLALRADFRIADRTARFGVPPAKLGLVYPADSTELLVRAVGVTMAKHMLYTAAMIDAAKALSVGLVSEIADGDVVEAAMAFAAPMIGNAPLSIAAAKIACDAAATCRTQEVAAHVLELSRMADASEDCREGGLAFAQKRPPHFVGR